MATTEEQKIIDEAQAAAELNADIRKGTLPDAITTPLCDTMVNHLEESEALSKAKRPKP